MLFRSETAFHPGADNASLVEWKRKNIENYLLVPDAWKRAALRLAGWTDDNLFAHHVLQDIDAFFAAQNLTLPPGQTWRTVAANIFSVVDGKRLLFENDDSLFHRLRQGTPSVVAIREEIALSMLPEEIHQDVRDFIARLVALVAGGRRT